MEDKDNIKKKYFKIWIIGMVILTLLFVAIFIMVSIDIGRDDIFAFRDELKKITPAFPPPMNPMLFE
jgi:hypothetical protein